jgi:ubiquinone/menaquinone biosynthesis C-methylase UbiE
VTTLAEIFITDREYPTYFSTLGGLREKVAESLPFSQGNILDVAAGSGYFSASLAKVRPKTLITAIDIGSFDAAKAVVDKSGVAGRVSFLKMDATKMDFPANHFDHAINFLGLEDIHMTRGRKGVEDTFREVRRVIKPGGTFSFTVMPADKAETPAQALEVEVFSYICDATWLKEAEYTRIAESRGLVIQSKKVFRTGKKLTLDQARKEIEFATANVPRRFKRNARSFDDAWGKYKDKVKVNGLGHYSRVELLVTRKPP